MNAGFWKGKRVLVTGHTGFKGSWLSIWLARLGAEVVGYALAPPTSPSNFALSRVGETMQSIESDIRDLQALEDCVARHRPEIVLHLAAQSLVRRSYGDPVETFQSNVMGTVNLLEAVRRHPSARAVVVVTSDKCYENREWHWGYRENEAMGGHDPYSGSKGCAELVAASYRNSFFPPDEHARQGVAVASARAGNVVGGGDWSEDRLVPDILDAHANGRELIIRSPAAVRPWQFVLEPLHGYMTLAERLYNDGPNFAEAWNFGPRDADVLTVEALIRRLSSHLDGGVAYRVAADERPHEATLLKLDCSKAAARLGWQPRTTLDDALRRIADWQNAFLAGRDMREVSIQQIENFQKISQGCR